MPAYNHIQEELILGSLGWAKVRQVSKPAQMSKNRSNKACLEKYSACFSIRIGCCEIFLVLIENAHLYSPASLIFEIDRIRRGTQKPTSFLKISLVLFENMHLHSVLNAMYTSYQSLLNSKSMIRSAIKRWFDSRQWMQLPRSSCISVTIPNEFLEKSSLYFTKLK